MLVIVTVIVQQPAAYFVLRGELYWKKSGRHNTTQENWTSFSNCPVRPVSSQMERTSSQNWFWQNGPAYESGPINSPVPVGQSAVVRESCGGKNVRACLGPSILRLLTGHTQFFMVGQNGQMESHPKKCSRNSAGFSPICNQDALRVFVIPHKSVIHNVSPTFMAMYLKLQ